MKKNYLNPTIDIVKLDVKYQILEGSVPGAQGGGSDGGVTPVDVDPNDPDYGSDY